MSPNDVEPAQQLINHLRIDANSVGCFGDLWAILALQSKLDPRPLPCGNNAGSGTRTLFDGGSVNVRADQETILWTGNPTKCSALGLRNRNTPITLDRSSRPSEQSTGRCSDPRRFEHLVSSRRQIARPSLFQNGAGRNC